MDKSIVTIITPATSRGFVTLSTLKSELGVTSPNTDTNLTRWILQASAQIESYCTRKLVQEKVSEQFRLGRQHYWPIPFAAAYDSSYTVPVSAGRLRLARYPVVSIDSVTVDGTALDITEFEVDPDSGLLSRLRNDHPSQWSCSKVVVIYTGGYTVPPAANPTIPADLQDAVINLAKNKRTRATRDPNLKSRNVVGVLEEDFWVGSISGNGDGAFPPDIAATIDPYVERRV